MPILTILLYLVTITLLGLLYYKSNINKYLIIGGLITAILVYVLQVLFTDTLWQQYPLYVAVLLLTPLVYCTLLKGRSVKRIRRQLIVITSTMLVFLSIALSYVFPVYELPEPTGQYPVGTSSVVLVNTSRFQLENSGDRDFRRFKIQFWYPAETTDGYDTVPWLEDGIVVARGLARDTGLPSFVLDHTITIESNSYKDAPVSTDQSSYPVIIISHGWRGFRNLHTDFAEDLASHGYIVISIDHTHGSVATDLDRSVEYVNYDLLPDRDSTEDFLDYANTLVYMYSNDIIDTINYIEAEHDENASRDYIAAMDLDKIGLIGHSTGGGAGVAAALEDDRIDAVFGLDSWVESIDPTIIDTGLSIPSVFIRSGQWEVGYNNEQLYRLINQSSTSSLYQIDGTTHYDFTMVYMYSPLTKQIGFTGDVEGRYLNTILSSMIREFFTDTLINNTYTSLTIEEWDEVRPISTE